VVPVSRRRSMCCVHDDGRSMRKPILAHTSIADVTWFGAGPLGSAGVKRHLSTQGALLMVGPGNQTLGKTALFECVARVEKW
jgi:hypothetical protein